MVEPAPSNYRVLACRPVAQNTEWVRTLSEAGFRVLDIPLLQITALHRRDAKQSINTTILQLDRYDSAIFVSQNAVAHAFEWVQRVWPQFPVGLSLFAVGKKTYNEINRFLEAEYASSHVSVEGAGDSMNSESLLALPAMNSVEGKNIVIFKGQSGRKTLQDNLVARGAKVDCCELYSRDLPSDAATAFANVQLDMRSDIFVVFSGETLANLDSVLANNRYTEKKSIPLLVPSERVAEHACRLGFQSVRHAKNASEASMMTSLRAMLAERVK